ncbi:undecaprenyl-phosphate glucose phosphotransferase [Roseibium litorale]|uniref:Undecaprenyl-phosphate glucose phosphotransferase n=1 Tax=Roseibium litorale TaxID=2803841 RepID=A0ABR9CPU1_9HYPH|nr:undecaprenyl-phosphate glucose phosphotransferase [Roseibium litorale]MBD8892879.1 undecaprenyl-phosphate glucose phosphotransferase [Roseibium litorale]
MSLPASRHGSQPPFDPAKNDVKAPDVQPPEDTPDRSAPELREHLTSSLRAPSVAPAPPPHAANQPKGQGESTQAHNAGADRPSLSEEALRVAGTLEDNAVSVPVLTGTVRLADIAVIVLTGLAAFITALPGQTFGIGNAVAIGLAMILALSFFQAGDAYQVPTMRKGLAQSGRVAGGWVLVFAVFALVKTTSTFGGALDQNWIGTWFVYGLIGLTAARFAVYRLVRHYMDTGRLERRAIIVGGGNAAADLIHELESQPENDIRICGIFDDRSNDRSPAVVAGYPKLGNIAALVEFCRLARIDMLIVCIPLRAEKRVLELLRRLWVLPVDIRLSAHTDKMKFRNRGASFIGSVPFVDVVEKPITDWDMVAKRVFDIFFASLSLIILSPVMVLTAIAIKLDSKGPVIFRQKRYGFNNEVIEVLKFRSMYADKTDAEAKKVVTKGDCRVTKVGRFIRKSSIDELPQLINVLRGELSLVGPRPHAVNAHTDNRTWDNVVDGYFARHKVKPGVTGWAQINGWRGEVDTPEKIQKRVEHDVFYIENWSILFDLKILLMTPICLLNTENAY